MKSRTTAQWQRRARIKRAISKVLVVVTTIGTFLLASGFFGGIFMCIYHTATKDYQYLDRPTPDPNGVAFMCVVVGVYIFCSYWIFKYGKEYWDDV